MSQFRLYEISDMLRQAIEAGFETVDENGIIPGDWDRFINDCQMERDQKCLDVARYIKSCLAEADAIKAEQKKLAGRAAALVNRADSLENYLTQHVNVGEKIKSADTIIGWRKSSIVTVPTDINTLPDKYIRKTIEANKVDIKEDLKKGIEIAGCQIIDCHNISIK